MTAASEPGAAQPRVLFDAILRPHRSLGPRGFAVLMGAVGGASLLVGLMFTLRGAWPVFGFFGLEFLLLYAAFRASFRSGRTYEAVRLTEDVLTVRRVVPRRPPAAWSFQPFWLRVSMDDPPRHESQVVLSSHGRRLVVGSFLSPEERLEFAQALRAALRRLRSPAHLRD